MTKFKLAYLERRERQFMRPDAHRYIRPDAWRFMAPGSPRYEGKDAVRYYWPNASKAGFDPDQPRDELGQWTSDGSALAEDTTVDSILDFAEKIAVSGSSRSYNECLDICYPLLERFKPLGSDRNQWDFIKCMNACLKRNK